MRVILFSDDSRYIQEALDNVVHSCKANGMELNFNKCYHITFTRKLNIIAIQYYLLGKQQLVFLILMFNFYIFVLCMPTDEDEATTSGITDGANDEQNRVIFVNRPQPQKFVNNRISTAKYR